MSPLRWTTKSTRALADELTRQKHKVSADTVGDLLREEACSLQVKTVDACRELTGMSGQELARSSAN